MWSHKNRKIAAALALAGAVAPLPIAGLHKFYLRQPLWGLLYLLLAWTPMARVASAIECAWYLFQDGDEFNRNFNHNLLPVNSLPPQQQSAMVAPRVSAIADDLRQLDCLREDGLISEYEFEQKRRQLLKRIT